MSRQRLEMWINLGLLIITGIMMLGGFASWCDMRYAKESELGDMKEQIRMIYEKLIRPEDRHR